MLAERTILTTDPAGNLSGLPKLPPNRQIEAIFLVLDDGQPALAGRRPHPDIAGKAKIVGDVMTSAPESDWYSAQ